MAGDATQAGAVECASRVWKPADTEAGEDAESGVKRGDIEAGDGPEQRVARKCEVADEPESAGSELCGEAADKGVDSGLSEAVQEKVRRDEAG